jgi:translation initiation factor 5A
MVFKLINATEAKVGVNIIVDGTPCVVKKMDVSKTGKHGHAKVRIEAIGLIDGVKKVFVTPGHDRIEVPLVEKKKAQVLSKSDKKASVMDLESFETIELNIPEDLAENIVENANVEYWDIEGTKIIKRTL